MLFDLILCVVLLSYDELNMETLVLNENTL